MAISDPEFLAGRPIVYEKPQSQKILTSVLCLGAILVLALVALGTDADDGGTKWLVLSGGIAIAGYVMYATFRNRLTLYTDRLEYRTALQTQTVFKSDITGFRSIQTRHGKKLVFQTRSTGNITTPDYRDNRALFREWLADFPDLNAIEAAAFTKSLEDSPAFGSDTARRKVAVAVHRKVASTINVIAFVLAFWLFLFGEPKIALEAACLAMPVVVLCVAALFGGRYTVLWERTLGRINLAPAFLLPMVSVAWRSFTDDSILDPLPALYMALACAGVGFLAIIVIERRMPPIILISVAGLILGSWGGVRLADVLADTSLPQVYTVVITDKQVYHHRKSPDEYRLYVDIHDQSGLPQTFDTHRSFYDRVHTGETLCLNLHKGALGYRWFNYAECAV